MTKEKPEENKSLKEECSFNISNEKIGEYLHRIKIIEESKNTKGITEDELNKNEDELNSILDELEIAVEERRVIHDDFKKNKLSDEKSLKTIEEIEFIVGEIAEIITPYYKEEEKEIASSHEKTKEEKDQEQINLLIPGGFDANKLHKKLGGKDDLPESEEEQETGIDSESEHEVFTSYKSIIESIIKNENPDARSIFLVEHKDIQKDLLKQIELIKKDKNEEELNAFITTQQEQIDSLIKLLNDFGSFDEKENEYLLNALKSDIRLLKKNKVKIKTISPENAVKPDQKSLKHKQEEESDSLEWAGYGIIDINNPKEPLYISYENAVIMKSKPGFFTKIMDSINKHNANIVNKEPRDVLDKSMEDIETIITEFKEYKKEWTEDMEKKSQQEEKPKKKKNKAETEVNVEPKKIQSDRKNETNIFYIEEGKDYHEMLNDKGFDTWLENITDLIKKDGVSVESEIKSLDDWYKEYKDALPYKNNLDKLFEDIRKTEGNNTIKILMTTEKISDLLYEIHKTGEIGKRKVDDIFSEYEKSKEVAEKIESLKQSKELRDKIVKERSVGNKTKELNTDQVKNILEARGRENTQENIDEMISFLQDMNNNYDSYYANANELVDDDMIYVYKRYRSASGKKPGSKISGVKKIWSSIKGTISSAFTDIDAVDFDNTTSLIKKTRELNLVNRKTGNKEKAMENKLKMEKLIAFTKGQTELLIEHIQNPKSNKEAEFTNEEDKQLLKTFDAMFKTFTESKYRGKEAKEKAEEVLLKTPSSEETTETTRSNLEILFDDQEEVKEFETKAIRQVTKEGLINLKTELVKLKETDKNITEWVRLSTKYDQIKTIFEALGDDMSTDLDMKTTSLMIEDLKLRYINKDNFKDLSANFSLYENIVNSSRNKEEKENIISDLIETLEKLKIKKEITKIQKIVLSDIIEKYKEVLKNIK